MEVKQLTSSFNLTKTLIMVLVASIILGGITGYILSSKTTTRKNGLITGQPPKSAAQDTKTFRDFAEGTIKIKPAPKDPNQYSEGTHFLERTGANPVALTSS